MRGRGVQLEIADIVFPQHPVERIEPAIADGVQAAYDLPKWKGRITIAHQLRAAFFLACAGQCPAAMWDYPRIWWTGMTGQIPRSMIAKATPMIEQAA